MAGCSGGDGLQLLQEHKVPVFGAVKRAGQHEQRDRWLQMVFSFLKQIIIQLNCKSWLLRRTGCETAREFKFVGNYRHLQVP